jgi:uncharacterized protein (DUF924 family)
VSAAPSAAAEDIVTFWRTAGPDRWFNKDQTFDDEIRRRFLSAYEAAASGRLREWETTATGALALCLLLDQFPRNMFRGDARSFAADALAREVAANALAHGFDRSVPAELRSFFYLPFMHSEQLADQERCVALYRTWGDREGIDYALLHADIIRRFGRFPHRNKLLGRTTTPAEQAFLDAGGFAG